MILTVFDLTWCIYPTQTTFAEPISTHTPELSEPKGTNTPDHSPFAQVGSSQGTHAQAGQWPRILGACKGKVIWSVQIPPLVTSTNKHHFQQEKSNHVECSCHVSAEYWINGQVFWKILKIKLFIALSLKASLLFVTKEALTACKTGEFWLKFLNIPMSISWV